jgi:drug/metabolite transporter (DMT)-like permease
LHVILSVILVMVGVGILSNFDWHELKLGRGEIETLLSSLMFTALILWIDRPCYARNHMGRVTAVSFAVTGLTLLPLALWTMPSVAHLGLIYNSIPTLTILLVLTVICTVGGMMLMYVFQRDVGAVAAAITYSCEPVFACLFAFFLPGWLSMWSGIQYDNEVLTKSLIVGGGLVLAANLVVQLKPREPIDKI